MITWVIASSPFGCYIAGFFGHGEATRYHAFAVDPETLTESTLFSVMDQIEQALVPPHI